MPKYEKLILNETDKNIELIFKPYREGIRSLSTEEFHRYLDLNVPQMKKTNLSIKTVIVCEETQNFLRKNEKIILNKILNKEEEENER